MSIDGELLRVGEEQKPSLLGRVSRKGYDYLSSALPDEDLLPTFSYILGSREVYVSRQEDVWLQLHLMNYDTATIAELTDTEAIDIEVCLARLDEALAGIDWEDVLFEIVGVPKTVPEASAVEPVVELEPTESAEVLPPVVTQPEADYLGDDEVVVVEPPTANRNAAADAPKPRNKVVRRTAVEPEPSPISDREFVPLGVRTLLEVLQSGLDATLSDEELETSWQFYANCAQTDPEAFFPEKGGTTRPAKKICDRCNVREECLDYALKHDERFGIWGGLSERERRKLKKRVI